MKDGVNTVDTKSNSRKVIGATEFIRRVNERFPEHKLSFEKLVYVNNDTGVTLVCKEHGDWTVAPKTILRSKGCPKCNGRTTDGKTVGKSGGGKAKSNEQFLEELRDNFGDLYDYSKVQYTRKDEKVILICKEEGHGEFLSTAKHLVRGYGGCPKCKGAAFRAELPAKVLLFTDGEGRYKPTVTNRTLQAALKYHKGKAPFSIKIVSESAKIGGAEAQFRKWSIIRKYIDNSAGLSGFNGSSEWVLLNAEELADVINIIKD